MNYKMSGLLKVMIPEGKEIKADSELEAIEKLLEELVEDGTLSQCLVLDGEFKMKKAHKIFKVRVTETFVHEVEIDTYDYEDIEDEWDAQRYVENNIDDFTDDFNYDYFERESHLAYCDSCDTVEDEEDC